MKIVENKKSLKAIHIVNSDDSLNSVFSRLRNRVYRLNKKSRIPTNKKQEKAGMEAIFDNISDTVILFSKDLKIQRINKSGLKLFDITEELALNRHFCDVLCHRADERKSKDGKKCCNCQLYSVLENNILQKLEINDKEVAITSGPFSGRSLRFTTRRIQKTNHYFYLAVINEMPDHAKMKKELKMEREKAEKSEKFNKVLLKNISHEIRTPLNSILGFINFFREELTTEQKNKFIDIINISGKKLISTIDDLIEISKLESGIIKMTPERFKLKNEVEEFLDGFNPLTKNKNVIFITRNEEILENDEIECDRSRLKQILNYLLDNAFKYTTKGFIELTIKSSGDFFHFSVKDTGTGISWKDQQNIFKAFYQGQILPNNAQFGTGLGLTIAQKLIERMEGYMWVESHPGKGSCFSFRLPHNVNFHENDHDAVLAGKTALIIEDEEKSYLKIRAILNDKEIQTFRGKNILDTVQILTTKRNIDLVLISSRILYKNGNRNLIMEKMADRIPVIAISVPEKGKTKLALEKNAVPGFFPNSMNTVELINHIEKHLNHNLTN